MKNEPLKSMEKPELGQAYIVLSKGTDFDVYRIARFDGSNFIHNGLVMPKTLYHGGIFEL